MTDIEEAVATYETLVAESPEVFAGDLWSALHTLADVLDALGIADEADQLRHHLSARPESCHRIEFPADQAPTGGSGGGPRPTAVPGCWCVWAPRRIEPVRGVVGRSPTRGSAGVVP